MTLWKSDIDRLLPGRILQIVERDGEEYIEECDTLRVVKIMSQSQNWNCSEEEAIKRIKKSSEKEPFVLDNEAFWYEED